MSTEIDMVEKTEEMEIVEVKKTPKFSLRNKNFVISLAIAVAVIIAIVSIAAVAYANSVRHEEAATTILEYTDKVETIDSAFYSDNATGYMMIGQMKKMSDLKASLESEGNSYVRSDSDLENTIDTDLAKMQSNINDFYVDYIASIESSYDLNSTSEDYQSLIDSYRNGADALSIVVNDLLRYKGLLNFNSMSFTTVEINEKINALESAITKSEKNLQNKIDTAISSYKDGITANTVENGSLESYRNAVVGLEALKAIITANTSFVGASDTKKYSEDVDSMISDYNAKAADLQAQADAAAAAAAKASSSGKTGGTSGNPGSTTGGRKYSVGPDGTLLDVTDACDKGYFDCTPG